MGRTSTGSAHLISMTDQTQRALTTSQALAAYDARMRAHASTTGRPTDRTSCAGLILGGPIGAVFHTGADGKIHVTTGLDDNAPVTQPLSYPLLAATLIDAYDLGDPETDRHVSALVADAATLRSLVKASAAWAQRLGTLEARRLARLLEYRSALPTSAYLPVLTEALASRYWLPGAGSLDDLAEWDAAFDHGHPTGSPLAFDYLADRAFDGAMDEKLFKALCGAEKYGSRAACSGASHSANSAFGQAGRVTDAYAAMLAVDPTLRDRNIVSGVVSKIRIHQIKSDRIEADIEDPGKLRDGSSVLLFDGVSYANKVEVTLKEVEFHNDRLMAVLSKPNRNNSRHYVTQSAHEQHRPLYLTPAPFLSITRTPRNKRWSSEVEDRNLAVDIPVDIALAGMPVAD